MGGLITSISVEAIGYISFLIGTTLNPKFPCCREMGCLHTFWQHFPIDFQYH